jgi:hypothetical protein
VSVYNPLSALHAVFVASRRNRLWDFVFFL